MTLAASPRPQAAWTTLRPEDVWFTARMRQRWRAGSGRQWQAGSGRQLRCARARVLSGARRVRSVRGWSCSVLWPLLWRAPR